MYDNEFVKAAGGWFNVIEFCARQLLLSVTVTVYVPIDKLDIVLVVAAPGVQE